MSIPRSVVLYGRANCHLCEESRRLLDRLAPEYGYSIEEVDITSDREIYLRYWDSIPVLVVGESVVPAALDEHRVRSVLDWEFREGGLDRA